MTKQQLIDWALARGWKLDKWGHLQKTGDNGKEFRLKLSSTSARYEVKVHHSKSQYSPASSEWVRMRSGYYKDLSISTDGKLSGMVR